MTHDVFTEKAIKTILNILYLFKTQSKYDRGKKRHRQHKIHIKFLEMTNTLNSINSSQTLKE